MPRNLTALSFGSLQESKPTEHVRFLGEEGGKGEEGARVGWHRDRIHSGRGDSTGHDTRILF